MYLESIVTLSEKEAELKQKSEDDVLLAKRQIAEAKAAGEARVREAAAKADADVKQMLREVNDRAKTAIEEKAAKTENTKAVLRARAEHNADKAAALIIERIVNG